MTKDKILWTLITIGTILSSCQQNAGKKIITHGQQRDSADLNAERLFTGDTYNGQDWYTCKLKISAHDSITLVASTDKKSIYYEEQGKIQQVKDSIYLIESSTYFFGGPMEDHFFNDSLYIYCDSLLKISKIKITYGNGLQQNISVKLPYLSIPTDKKLFNKTSKYLGLDIGHVDPITREPVTFTAWYGSAYSITTHKFQHRYFLILKGNSIRTINTAPLQTGHFQLIKKETSKKEETKPYKFPY